MDQTWTVVERPCDFERRRGKDALFTLGNGYLGCRGFFEEEQEEGVEALGGIYMAGVFGKGELKAWNGMHRELVNTPNFLWVSIRVDGEQVLPRPGRSSAYVRTLDMRRGTVQREWEWKSSKGARVRLRFERFMSLADRHLAGQRLEITPLEGAPRIELCAGIDARITQHNMVTTIPLPIQPGRRHLKTLEIGEDGIRVQAATLPDGVRIAEKQQVVVEGAGGSLPGEPANGEALLSQRFAWDGQAGATVRMTKVIGYYTSRDGEESTLLREKMGQVQDYDVLLAAHEAEWQRKWESADIEVDGAEDDQRALRFNLFHLMQACPSHDSRVSLGARGLSGEMHEGSVFWDNEIFKLPFFTFTDPAATRSMLRFRHRTLPAAKRHARELWFDGAMYAWKSGDDGVEETEMGVGAYYAIHIIADIAYALRQYWEASGDDEFLFRYGTEVLLETARFWKSRMQYNPELEKFEIRAVRGPNEYDVIVHNNCYTNRLAQENLLGALDAIAYMRKQRPAEWKKLARRCRFDEKEGASWKRAARDLMLPYEAKRDLYVEDDGYLRRAPFDMRRGKPDGRRVIDSVLPYESMAFYQITKQSDVITMMNLLPWRFTARQQRVAYDFYEPRTVHDSSLSYAPHAVMAARLGRMPEAYRYFRDCAYLDLDDLQLNTISGLHFANLGGTWQAAVMGFAGLWVHENRLHLDPHLPANWKAMRFRLWFRGARLQVAIEGSNTSVTLEKGGEEAVSLEIGGRAARLEKVGQTVTVQKKAPARRARAKALA